MKIENILFGAIAFLFFPLTITAQKIPQLMTSSLDDVIKVMTLDEKISIVTGAAGTTHAIPRLGIPAIVMADGPAGIRIASKRIGKKCTIGYLCVKVPAHALAKPQVLLALFVQDLYIPSNLINLEGLDECHAQISTQQYVPALVPAILDEENAHRLVSQLASQCDIAAFVQAAVMTELRVASI